MRWLIFICALGLRAQSLSIDANVSPQDCALSPIGAPTVALPCSVNYFDSSLPITNLRYGYVGATLTYTLTVPSGPVFLTLSFVEPNKTGPGQRLFDVRVNNGPPMRLDLFAMAGLKKQLDLTLPVQVLNGRITIVLKPIVGNALVSGIFVQTLDTFQTTVSQWLTCSKSLMCSGIDYLEITKGDGTMVNMLTVPAPIGFTLDTGWTPVIQ